MTQTRRHLGLTKPARDKQKQDLTPKKTPKHAQITLDQINLNVKKYIQACTTHQGQVRRPVLPSTRQRGMVMSRASSSRTIAVHSSSSFSSALTAAAASRSVVSCHEILSVQSGRQVRGRNGVAVGAGSAASAGRRRRQRQALTTAGCLGGRGRRGQGSLVPGRVGFCEQPQGQGEAVPTHVRGVALPGQQDRGCLPQKQAPGHEMIGGRLGCRWVRTRGGECRERLVSELRHRLLRVSGGTTKAKARGRNSAPKFSQPESSTATSPYM